MLMQGTLFLNDHSSQMKAEDPLPRSSLFIYVVVSRAVCKTVFSSHSEVFSLVCGHVYGVHVHVHVVYNSSGGH